MMSGTVAQHLAVLERDEVLVLDLEAKHAARVGAEPLDRARSRGRTPPVVRRSTSTTLPTISTAAPSSSASAATGSCSASSTTAPIRMASETGPRTVAVFA